MRMAVLADLHANLPALAAVRARVDEEKVDEVVVLGDLVGYNAHPDEVVEAVRSWADVVVAGNHDRDVEKERKRAGTNKAAAVAQAYSLQALSSSSRTYLRELPNLYVAESYVAAHGCYLNSDYYYGYVTSTMLEENLLALCRQRSWPRVAFCGHTHMPLCGWLAGEKMEEWVPRAKLYWPRDADAVLINPGAVGQPRDGDPRSAFALVDFKERSIEICRVEYDVARAAEAIVAAGLPVELANRLHEGR